MHQNAAAYSFIEKDPQKGWVKIKTIKKLETICHFTGKYRSAATSISNLSLNVPNKFPVVFHKGSDCDSHFLIKELANEFERQFDILGKTQKSTKPFLFQ